MRYMKIRWLRMKMLKRDLFQKILITNIGLNPNEAKQFADMNKTATSYAKHRLMNNCLLYRKHEVTVKPFENLQYCLWLLPHSLEHRINVLKDMGVKELNVTQISKIFSYLNKPVFKFKQLEDIPTQQDIRENIFSRLSEPPRDMSQLDSLNDLMKTKEYYNRCLLLCKTEVFNLPNLDDAVLLEKDIKHKSISMITETLKVLRQDLGFDNKYIQKNPKVIIASAENVKLLLNNFRDTGLIGVPIEKMLKKYPYLLFEDANNIKQLLQSFKRYDIPEDYARKCMKIFTLGNDFFLERMGMIMKHPDLHLWHKHPRILQLILFKNMAMDRADYLHYVNRIKWARAHTVLSQKKMIDKFVQYGPSTLMSPKAVSHLLDIKLKIQSNENNLVKKLNRHPHWRTAGFNDIEKMIDYLLENFTVDEICKNIHIILYSRSVVEEMLANLRNKYSQSTEYSFTNSQYLSLCLYMLEKDTHFTGDGIWSKGHNVQDQSSLKNQIVNNIDSDANIDVSSIRTNKADSNFCDKHETKIHRYL